MRDFGVGSVCLVGAGSIVLGTYLYKVSQYFREGPDVVAGRSSTRDG
jgi:hypothetical protein